LRSAGALGDPPAGVTERGFKLAIDAAGAEAAQTKEMAVQGIHSHTGVYLVEELDP
jgi:hypothetical protein